MAAEQTDLAKTFSDLKLRVASAAVLALIGGLAVWLGGIWFAVFIALLAGAIGWEWRSITHHGGAACGFDAVPLITAVAGAALATHIWDAGIALIWLIAALAGGLVFDVLWAKKTAAFWSLIGGLYCGGAAIGLVWLRAFEPYGLNSVIWIVIVVAAADIGGYFAGKTFGGPKLWPRVSPKKTWSGALGGIALAAALGAIFSGATSGTYYYEVSVVSALAAMISQAGDLAESALKRRFAVKDASNLIPGHGGVLDRFDGLMAAVIVAVAITGMRGQTVFIW